MEAPKTAKNFFILAGAIALGVVVGMVVVTPVQHGVNKLMGSSTPPPAGETK